MTDADQTTPTEADSSLSGLIDQARTTPQGITALLFAYAQELVTDDGPPIAGLVLVSADTDANALQAHIMARVDSSSMARVLRAQADVLSSPLPEPQPAGVPDAPGSASPWHPEDDDTAEASA